MRRKAYEIFEVCNKLNRMIGFCEAVTLDLEFIDDDEIDDTFRRRVVLTQRVVDRLYNDLAKIAIKRYHEDAVVKEVDDE